MGLSVTIITKNGEESIRQCLESVKWADEIIVLDSGSTDNTVAICREYTPHVFETDWPGYAKQKMRANAKATQEWVLSIDEDEWLTPELAQEIQETLPNAPEDVVCYEFKQLRYVGDILLKSPWTQSWHIDLYRRTKTTYSDHLVHEGPLFTDGRILKLKHLAYHRSHRDISELIEKLNQYTSLSAKDKLRRGRTGTVLRGSLYAVWMFFKAYILKGAILDRGIGFVLAVHGAENSFYRYAKMQFKDKE